jgi:hypothetical protein
VNYTSDANDNETGAGNRTVTYGLANRLATTTARGTTTTYTFAGRRIQAIPGRRVRGRHGLTPLTVESLRPSGSGWRRSLRLGRLQLGRQSTLCDGLSTAARESDGDSGQDG